MERQLEFHTASGYLKFLNLNSEQIIDKTDLSFNIQNDISFAVNESDYSQIKLIMHFELTEMQNTQNIITLEYETVFQTNNNQANLPERDIVFVQKLIEHSLSKVANIVSFISFETFGKSLNIPTNIEEIQ